MDYLNYESKVMEPFAIRVISKSFDNSYEKYIWHDKDDDFDYTSPNDKAALEVVTVIPENIKNVLKYESSLKKGNIPKNNNVKGSTIDESGKIVSYYGGSIFEIVDAVIYAIEIKEAKRIKRIWLC